jgi:hypothetical protein
VCAVVLRRAAACIHSTVRLIEASTVRTGAGVMVRSDRTPVGPRGHGGAGYIGSAVAGSVDPWGRTRVEAAGADGLAWIERRGDSRAGAMVGPVAVAAGRCSRTGAGGAGLAGSAVPVSVDRWGTVVGPLAVAAHRCGRPGAGVVGEVDARGVVEGLAVRGGAQGHGLVVRGDEVREGGR